MASIADNLFLLTTLVLSACAWIISFIGACVFRRGLSGGAWWIIVYELMLIIITSTILTTNTYAHYRYMILTFLAASISMVTYQIDFVLPVTKFTAGYRSGASAYAAGYIILMIIQFLWVIVFGSEKESRIGKYAPSQYGNTVGIVGQQYEMTAKTDSPEHNRVASPTHPATVEPNMTSSEIAPPNFEYREKVQALHAYQANPEDPNELSFTKGEILEVVDRNGNWWQARKSDGTIGIIPSNYAVWYFA